MRLRSVLAWLFVLAVAAGVYLWSSHQAQERQEARRAETKVLELADPLAVQALELSGEDYPRGPVRIERRPQEHSWQMVAPVQWTADSVLVGKLLGAALELQAGEVLEAPARPEEFGLRPPRARLQLSGKGGESAALLLGDTSPTGKFAYAAPPALDRLWLVPVRARQNIALGLYELRDKSALEFVVANVAGVEVELEGRSLSLVREQGGAEPVWRFGDGGEASPEAVEDLLFQLHGLRVTEFVDRGIKPAEMGLEPPRGRIELALEGGGAKGLVVGGPAATGGERYLRRLAGGSVMVVKEASLQRLEIGRHALAERRVWKLARRQVVALSVQRDGQTLAYAKEQGRWKRTQPPGGEKEGMPGSLLVWELAQLKYEKLLPPEGDYGLDEPAITLELTLAAQEKTQGQVQVKTLYLGQPLEKQGLVPARVAGDSRVYGLDAALLDNIPRAGEPSPGDGAAKPEQDQ
jgi:hypothetical protein